MASKPRKFGLRNGKRVLAQSWYVNEGDGNITIPCEMDVGKAFSILCL